MNLEPQSHSPRVSVAMTSENIDVTQLLDEVADPAAGAVDLFVGTVRDHSTGREGVTHLDYEAYEEEVVGVIEAVVAEATQKWDLLGVAIRHRVGRVPLDGVAVAVAVSGGHRAEVFEGCRYLIDELKKRAPIWKKEHWDGGEEWVLGS